MSADSSGTPALFSVEGVSLGEEAGAERHRDAPAQKADAKRIDWNDSCHELGAGVPAMQPGGKRGGQQPNLTEFNRQPKAGKKPVC
jgi:hypothetical protein